MRAVGRLLPAALATLGLTCAQRADVLQRGFRTAEFEVHLKLETRDESCWLREARLENKTLRPLGEIHTALLIASRRVASLRSVEIRFEPTRAGEMSSAAVIRPPMVAHLPCSEAEIIMRGWEGS